MSEQGSSSNVAHVAKIQRDVSQMTSLRSDIGIHDTCSYVELQLPFSKDPQLADRYIATSGSIRLGKIFEDLDNLAGDSE